MNSDLLNLHPTFPKPLVWFRARGLEPQLWKPSVLNPPEDSKNPTQRLNSKMSSPQRTARNDRTCGTGVCTTLVSGYGSRIEGLGQGLQVN